MAIIRLRSAPPDHSAPAHERSYERFNDTNDNQVDWTRLLISTRELTGGAAYDDPDSEADSNYGETDSDDSEPVSDECAICMGCIEPVPLEGDPSTTTRCGHTFHAACLAL